MGSEDTAMLANFAGSSHDALDTDAGAVALARMIGRLNHYRSEDDVIRAVLAESVSLLGGTSSVVHVLDEENTELVMMGSIGMPSEQLLDDFGRMPLDAPLPAIDAMRTGKVVVIRSVEDRRRRYPLLDDTSFDCDPAFVVSPMYDASGGPFGVLGIGLAGEAEVDALDLELLAEVTNHSALALHRARQTAAAQRNQEQLAFLDALSGALSRNLDVRAALTHLAELTVPRLADWCAVRVLESAARPGPVVGVAHRDQTKVDQLHGLTEDLSAGRVANSALENAFRRARPFVRDGVDVATVAEEMGCGDSVDVLEAVGAAAVLVFPLMARGRLIGALGFGNLPGRHLSQDDFDLAHAAAVRAAVLVDNARMFAERSEIARALQDSLLPGVLPEVSGVELGARYRPAGQGLDVGGDFYDAFQADANWWVFAVGDVCGHGVEAASLTGLARHTIRSAAMSGVMPSAVLRHLNGMLLQQSAEAAARHDDDSLVTPRFCTVLVGAVQQTEGNIEVVLCSAGHPLPLIRRANDTVEPVGVPGTLLGVTDDVTLTDVMVHLAPGESLVCYTDGVTDRRRGRRSFGDEGVVATVLRGKGLSAVELAKRVENDSVTFLDDEPADDMAVLVLKAVAQESAAEGAAVGGGGQVGDVAAGT